MGEWEAELNTALDRLSGAAENAKRAAAARAKVATIATSEEQAETNASMATLLLSKAPVGVASLAVIAKVFASGSGKTVDELLAMVATAAK